MNKNYLPLLSGWLKSIRKHNPLVDIAIIIPNDLTINNDEFKDAIFLRTNSFDYVYSSKYIITEFEIFNNYTDFLYLDLDIICTKPLDHIFAKIAEYPEKIHTRTEDFCLNSTSTFHKFSKDTVVDNDLRAFNAGSFGFNHSFKEEMRQFLSFINDNKNLDIYQSGYAVSNFCGDNTCTKQNNFCYRVFNI